MAPFTVQARRFANRDTTRSLQPEYRIVPNDTSPRCRLLHQHLFNLPSVMKDTEALIRYYSTCTSFHILLVYNARITGVNGRVIPVEWLVEDSYARGNYMIVDAQWAKTDFIIEEVY